MHRPNSEILNCWVSVDGLRIHYLENQSSRPAILFLHGGGSDSSSLSFKKVLPLLKRDFRVIAPDLPGYGLSEGLTSLDPLPFYTSFLEKFIDALGLQRPSLVGLSMGGAIALAYCLRHPKNVNKLILVGSYGLSRNHWKWLGGYFLVRIPMLYSLLRRWILRCKRCSLLGVRYLVGNKSYINRELLDDAWQALQQAGPALAWKAFIKKEIKLTGFRTSFWERLPEIRQPVLLIHGERDRMVPAQNSIRAARKLPQAHLILFPTCGHWVPREVPLQFAASVKAFLLPESVQIAEGSIAEEAD